MAPAPRIASKPPTRAVRRRLGAVAASLAGGLAGLAAGAACGVIAPHAAAGRAPGVAVPTSSGLGVGDRERSPVRDGVARVLAPARDAGVPAASRRDVEEGAP